MPKCQGKKEFNWRRDRNNRGRQRGLNVDQNATTMARAIKTKRMEIRQRKFGITDIRGQPGLYNTDNIRRVQSYEGGQFI